MEKYRLKVLDIPFRSNEWVLMKRKLLSGWKIALYLSCLHENSQTFHQCREKRDFALIIQYDFYLIEFCLWLLFVTKLCQNGASARIKLFKNWFLARIQPINLPSSIRFSICLKLLTQNSKARKDFHEFFAEAFSRLLLFVEIKLFGWINFNKS